ncbi:MAG: SseB family protein [Methanobrevibacter sp.]|nr:SseB family protein [Methanobrevibacter sp.]
MDEKIENPQLKAIMATDPENMSEEELTVFVESFMAAQLIVPAEVNSDMNLDEMTDEEIALDEEIDINIIKIEDEEGHEFIPVFTDDEEVEKLDFEVYGLVFETEDLAKLLYETIDDDIEGIVLNPFTEFTAEIPLESLFGLFDLEECDDPNCDNPHHHHHDHDHEN